MFSSLIIWQVFVDAFFCRYEQEEVFFSLNVTVKNATLQDSLDQFVKGELLEGSNAYFCEKCGVKVWCFVRILFKNFLIALFNKLYKFT